MPLVFCEAADQLKPEELANYANVVAEKFHEYYEKVDVIHAEEQVRNARAHASEIHSGGSTKFNEATWNQAN